MRFIAAGQQPQIRELALKACPGCHNTAALRSARTHAASVEPTVSANFPHKRENTLKKPTSPALIRPPLPAILCFNGQNL
jgi:hypothetical protein